MGKIMKSLTLGGIIGFIAGLLFAPQKGEKTREKLQEVVEEGRKKFEEIKKEVYPKKK